MADCIAVLDDGRIVEHGSHKELLALGGKYAKIHNMQAAKYRQVNELGAILQEKRPFRV